MQEMHRPAFSVNTRKRDHATPIYLHSIRSILPNHKKGPVNAFDEERAENGKCIRVWAKQWKPGSEKLQERKKKEQSSWKLLKV